MGKDKEEEIGFMDLFKPFEFQLVMFSGVILALLVIIAILMPLTPFLSSLDKDISVLIFLGFFLGFTSAFNCIFLFIFWRLVLKKRKQKMLEEGARSIFDLS